jgi:hypothetical protein
MRAHQRTLFPEPAKDKFRQGVQQGKIRRRTLPMDPQQRTSGLPLLKKTTSEEPVRCALVLGAALDNMIRGWIGR